MLLVLSCMRFLIMRTVSNCYIDFLLSTNCKSRISIDARVISQALYRNMINNIRRYSLLLCAGFFLLLYLIITCDQCKMCMLLLITSYFLLYFQGFGTYWNIRACLYVGIESFRNYDQEHLFNRYFISALTLLHRRYKGNVCRNVICKNSHDETNSKS